jgi:hypothetical protein
LLFQVLWRYFGILKENNSREILKENNSREILKENNSRYTKIIPEKY